MLRVLFLVALFAAAAAACAVVAAMRKPRGAGPNAAGYAALEEYGYAEPRAAPPPPQGAGLMSPAPGAAASTPIFHAESPPLFPTPAQTKVAPESGEPPYSPEVEALRARVRAGYVLLETELGLLEATYATRQREIGSGSWSA